MNLKTGAAICCALLAVCAASAAAPADVATRRPAQQRSVQSVTRGGVSALPDAALIDDFDRAVQKRFLKTPGFGMARINIGPPPQPHLHPDRFVPTSDEEFRVVKDLQEAGWKVGVYLFGRHAYERPKGEDAASEKVLYVEYKLNRPVPVTTNTKSSELPAPRRLRGEVAEALYRFQETNSHTFASGKWTYVARPVRASESCLKCHTDMFVTKKTGKNTYTYRPRLAGDPIGALVYAFARPE